MTSDYQTPRPLLTVEQIADQLNLSARTVRRRIDSGELRAFRLGIGPKAPVRVDPAELNHWLERRRQGGITQ